MGERVSLLGSQTNSTKDASSTYQQLASAECNNLNVKYQNDSTETCDQVFKCPSNDRKESKDSTVLDRLLLGEEIDQPADITMELQRAKSSSMHQNTRSNLLPASHFPQRVKTGLAELAESNWAPNHRVKTKSSFWQLGGDDSLMIDETQEINRKVSKDSMQDMNGTGSEEISVREEQGTPTALVDSSSRDHPDTPYPILTSNEKPISEVGRV